MRDQNCGLAILGNKSTFKPKLIYKFGTACM